MCVIAFSPRGVSIPTPQQIQQMWNANPDGAGYAYVNKKGRVVYRKGFMSLDELLKELEAPEKFKGTNFALHFRIGTSGKNDSATCHPFPLSTNFGDLRKTEGEEDAVLFHNGVLASGGIVSPLSSDTQDFVVAMTPLLRKHSRSKSRDFFIEELIEGNRILVLYKNNAFKMFGKWKKDGDIWVSNTHYQQPYDWYGSGCYGASGWWDEDDWDELYFSEEARQRIDGAKKYNPTPTNTKEAAALWEQVIEHGYGYFSKSQLELLKESAEFVTGEEGGTLERAGFELGYDVSDHSIIVWLEDTPEQEDKEGEDNNKENSEEE